MNTITKIFYNQAPVGYILSQIYMKSNRMTLSILLAVVFFGIGLSSLPHYGVNWDEPVHFGRGQAILHYFFTGKKDYADLEKFQPARRSFYQSEAYTFNFFEKKFTAADPLTVGGHPPLSGFLATISNVIFYQKLGILGDIEAYHLYGVFVSAVFIGIIFYFVHDIYGPFIAMVATISLMTYPLFLGESRFNIKDPPEACYFGITLICFYYTVVRNRPGWILFTAIFFGLGLATKLNIVFALPIMFFWAVVVGRRILPRWIFVVPLIGAVIFFVAWPMLWIDPVSRILKVFEYYTSIGTNAGFDPRYLTIFRINTYALQWILYTTPVGTLFFSFLGIFYAVRSVKKDKNKLSLLLLLWFFVPLARVTVPNANIYGGVRQIMEYIPPMAILAGIGAGFLIKIYKNYSFLLQILILLSFVPITLKMISMYPNESVYFNPLIGGLKGAKERNIPGWGNSLGSTYRQGIRWINTYAQREAKIATLFGLRSNIALTDIRADIEFESQFRSGIMRQGEYIIGPTHEGSQEDSYLYKYLERFLEPAYQLKAQGVPILKVWKNDLAHTKEDYQNEKKIIGAPSYSQNGKTLIVDAGSLVKFTKVDIRYPPSSCLPPREGYIEYSTDGERWSREGNDLAHRPIPFWFQTEPDPGTFQFLFAAEPARYIQFVNIDPSSCLFKKPLHVTISYL